MIVGIDHVQITVPPHAIVDAKAFYCGLLGLPEIEKPASLQARGGFWLQVGGRQLHVGIEDGVNRHATKAHVAYAVKGVAAWRARLAEAGVEIIDSIPMPGHERFELRDPFGNRLELIEATAAR